MNKITIIAAAMIALALNGCGKSPAERKAEYNSEICGPYVIQTVGIYMALERATVFEVLKAGMEKAPSKEDMVLFGNIVHFVTNNPVPSE